MAWLETSGGGGTGGGTPGFHPNIEPSSVTNMKRAGPLAPPMETTNPVPAVIGGPLKTTPVGSLSTITHSQARLVSATFATMGPLVLYSVDVPVPLLATQNGDVADDTSPQELTSESSCRSATPGKSETRLCCR